MMSSSHWLHLEANERCVNTVYEYIKHIKINERNGSTNI